MKKASKKFDKLLCPLRKYIGDYYVRYDGVDTVKLYPLFEDYLYRTIAGIISDRVEKKLNKKSVFMKYQEQTFYHVATRVVRENYNALVLGWRFSADGVKASKILKEAREAKKQEKVLAQSEQIDSLIKERNKKIESLKKETAYTIENMRNLKDSCNERLKHYNCIALKDNRQEVPSEAYLLSVDYIKSHINNRLCGVYFIRDCDDSVIYVGKSINLQGRLCQHAEEIPKRMQFTHGQYRYNYIECFEDELNYNECYYIGLLRPILNFIGERTRTTQKEQSHNA